MSVIKGHRTNRLAQGIEAAAKACVAATENLASCSYWIQPTGTLESHSAIALTYSPVARGNPFQSMLYSRAWQHGVAPFGLHHLEDLRNCPWPGPRVAHLHWIGQVLAKVGTVDEARSAIQRFTVLIDELKRDQVRIVWSMHNALPHDCAFADEECALRQALVDAADLIHVMHPNHVEATAAYFTVDPRKVFCVSHPSYLGVYPDYVSRETARFELGLGIEDFVVLFFGAARRYKGITLLLDAFRDLKAAHNGRAKRFKLVLAGAFDDADLLGQATERARFDDDITLVPEKIPGEDVQLYFRAADIAIVPQQRMLNSGTLQLAFSFGLPAIVANTALKGLHDAAARAVVPFDAASPDALCDAMLKSSELDLAPHRAAAAAYAQTCSPHAISDAFCTELRSRLTAGKSDCPATVQA